jgi:hypothetical protein
MAADVRFATHMTDRLVPVCRRASPIKEDKKGRVRDMNGVLDDHCHLKGHPVIVSDCETCLGERQCDPICFYRGFVWGRPDERKPLWVHHYETMRKRVLAFTMHNA